MATEGLESAGETLGRYEVGEVHPQMLVPLIWKHLTITSLIIRLIRSI
jgi:hypothetical protein